MPLLRKNHRFGAYGNFLNFAAYMFIGGAFSSLLFLSLKTTKTKTHTFA